MRPQDLRPVTGSGERAVADMVAIIRAELGVVVTPDEVRELFKKRWTSLSVLAHTIHHAYCRDSSTTERTV